MTTKWLKKQICIVAGLCLMIPIFVGCTGSKESKDISHGSNEKQQENAVNKSDTDEIKLAALKGPTSMGIVKLLEDKKINVSFNMYNSADEIVPLIVKKQVDMASIPANLAAVLYEKTKGNIVALNVNTLGVLYGVSESSNIKDIKDLEGKTVFMTGKGTVPEYSLKYLLEKNGVQLEKVKIEFKSEPTEVVAALKVNKDSVGILPQPFTTVALNNNDKLKIVLDLTECWEKSSHGESSMVTAVTVVRKDFLNQHKELVNKFMEEQKKSVEFTKNNIDEAANLIEKYDIVKAAIAKKALPYCNLVCITGDEMNKKLEGYLTTLYNSNKASVGGKLPRDDFYYKEN
ncbi:NitT/TauT family transport system substrate-binding protein [Hathewaya proteolytica DSM 3090]|uniref:NitT/TauT family transport system substrate-binding protein n=1 Tax=Hathewaya proteolytica DSM 3090 TaxID=1121331 RepID=A0A1M6QY38_9CLOT|nr:ABC transporter substrate-binding protein [Hathewaya proteolytica]SHK25169.1 NitT/TauT family transport system substrate-binding protein [Hathewaya proteolytica DSM 3090]